MGTRKRRQRQEELWYRPGRARPKLRIAVPWASTKEESIHAMLPLVLQGQGFDVKTAASVPEALQKIKGNRVSTAPRLNPW